MKLKVSDIAQDIDTSKKAEYADKKTELGTKSLISAQDATQRAVVEVGKALISFIGQHQPQVTVKNQPTFPKSIATPDVKAVVNALNDLIKITQTKEPDNSKIEVKLRDILEQMKSLPKVYPAFPKFPEIPSSVEIRNQLDFTPALDSLESAIKALKLDPKINVAAPKVTVNNNELASAIEAMGARIQEAIAGIELTETAPDFTTLEKAVKKVEQAVHQIEFPIPPTSKTGLIPSMFDEINIVSYNANNDPTVVRYKDNSKTLFTLTITYDGSNRITKVVRT